MHITNSIEEIYVIGVRDKGYLNNKGQLINDVFQGRIYLDKEEVIKVAKLYRNTRENSDGTYVRALHVSNAGAIEI
ncbi:hypothetical protein HUB98_05675 [Paenibacillus barcinonensis]|uniref:Uncharacterized protein n=1 Tax=Paenibacillus barcinonensis TaxID=198119 RepID=A0A2V4VEI9_PAEBA|nr:hypothetical protein [Paenibacillus barcinonensis]PYE51484.1 hypothetical protein DFQ00_102278 [Paenibacillus barcinonensis]QKS55869.1 hypothetical protein HUB98_05675 [Paenibacillus barcinonensis]